MKTKDFMSNKTSPHILSTSANLLGFCLFVITSFHISNSSEISIIDEFTSFIAILLTISCIFSFFSIRIKMADKAQKLENIADYLFIFSLTGIFIIIVLISLNFIK